MKEFEKLRNTQHYWAFKELVDEINLLKDRVKELEKRKTLTLKKKK